MRIERSWAHCPMCPDEVWLPTSEMVRSKKPLTIRGMKSHFICRKHAVQLIKQLKAKGDS